MTDLPPRTAEEEVLYQADRVRFELRKELDGKFANERKVIDELVKDHAALKEEFAAKYKADRDLLEKSVADYKNRLLWFSSGLGVLVVGLVATWVTGLINTSAEEAVREGLATSTAQITEDFNEAVDQLQGATEAIITEQLRSAILLPLLVGAAVDLAEGREAYGTVEEVMVAMRIVQPAILELEGIDRVFAINRIEALLDALWRLRRYNEMMELTALFGPTLLEDDGAHFTVSLATASVILIEGSSNETVDALVEDLSEPLMGVTHPRYGPLRVLSFFRDMEASGWDEAAAIAQAQQESFDFPPFERLLEIVVSRLEVAVAGPDAENRVGRHYSPDALNRHVVATNALRCIERPDAGPCTIQSEN